jgi:hypothetical protein
MELRRGIAFHRSRGVMLEGRGGELARRLRLPNVADPRLGVPLQLSQRHADTLAVRLPHPVIAAYQRGQRDGLRRGERRIPPGAVLDRSNLLAVLALIGLGYLVPNKLRLSVWVLAFAQTSEVFRAHGSRKSPLSGEPSLPLAMPLLVAAPVVLLTRSKLPRMIRPRLTCRERFGDGQHRHGPIKALQ